MKQLLNNLVIELHIPDFEKAKKFYSLFEFEQLSYDPPIRGGLGYLVLKREDRAGRTLINFYGGKNNVSQHSYFAEFPADTPRGYAVEVVIPVSDVETLWNSVKDKLANEQVAQPLKRKRWSQKDFRVIDPFGFYIRFTELVDWGQ